jgi:hypothetical protein
VPLFTGLRRAAGMRRASRRIGQSFAFDEAWQM